MRKYYIYILFNLNSPILYSFVKNIEALN